jgi:putative flippase GtrA
MKDLLRKLRENSLYQKLVNRETITYVIAGILTTLVNFVSYEGLYRLKFSNLTANWIAWVIAVTFAYIVNKWNVFRSKSETAKDETFKVLKFFGARIVTLVVEQLGMYIFVERMGIYRWIIKGALSVIVIILNYIFSKLYIFNENKDTKASK